MSKLILIYLTLLVGNVFMILPKTGPADYFMFSDMELYFATHVYFICERLVLIVLAGIIANEATEYRGAMWVFFGLIVVDLFDYLLTYSGVWFHFYGVPVSFNILKGVIFGMVIIREWTQRL